MILHATEICPVQFAGLLMLCMPNLQTKQTYNLFADLILTLCQKMNVNCMKVCKIEDKSLQS